MRVEHRMQAYTKAVLLIDTKINNKTIFIIYFFFRYVNRWRKIYNSERFYTQSEKLGKISELFAVYRACRADLLR